MSTADQRVPAAAHHRGAVRAHHLHRHRDRRRQAVDHLAEAVADQQHVAMRIEQLRHAHRVGGQHHDRLFGLARRTLRARIEGAVMRLPGTGDGVARLVPVSIVKVDMARASNGRALTPPVRCTFRRRNVWNFAAPAIVEQCKCAGHAPRVTIGE